MVPTPSTGNGYPNEEPPLAVELIVKALPARDNVTFVPATNVVVATHCGRPLFQLSTCPGVPVPNIEDVAMNVGTADAEVLFDKNVFALAAPKAVVIAVEPDPVTAPVNVTV